MKTAILVVVMSLLLAPAVIAKRAPPADVKPALSKGVEDRAPQDKMGFVEAWDKAAGKMLWEKRVYEVQIDPALERDVQHVFITKLEVDAGKLLVSNERNEHYTVDLKTQAVTKRAVPESPAPDPARP